MHKNVCYAHLERHRKKPGPRYEHSPRSQSGYFAALRENHRLEAWYGDGKLFFGGVAGPVPEVSVFPKFALDEAKKSNSMEYYQMWF